MLPAATGALPGTRAVTASADDRTASQNNLRTDWDPTASKLSPAVVGSSSFGLLPHFPVKLNGQIYAQPLVVTQAGIPEVIVATETNWVYGINGRTGAINWSTNLGTPYYITNCNNVAPYVGVTSTPVYDPATGKVYLIAETGTGASTSFSFIGIDPATGAITMNVPIGGTPTNDPDITFDPQKQLQRPGLLLLDGSVYAAFGSHCDYQPYAGFLAGVNLTSHATTLWTDESGVTDNQAGIWNSGGGLLSDGSGRIFFTSGNGVSPAPGPGNKPPGQLAESLVRLGVNSDGSLVAKDFFSPANAPKLDAADTDWGSGGPIGLPFSTSNGTSTYYMIMQVGKDGRVFILNRNNLGGREQGPGSTDAHLAYVGRYGGQWGHPAAFRDTATLTPANSAAASDYAYYVGRNDYLRIFKFGAATTGKPTVSSVATSSATFPYATGSPVVTSKGTDPSSAIVWVVGAAGTGGAGTLEAFPATPKAAGWPADCTSACSLSPIFSAATGTAASFSTPATSNNAVYVGTLDGYLYGFGILPVNDVLAGGPVSYGKVSAGSARTENVTATARATVTVTGVSAVTTSSGGSSTAAQYAVHPGLAAKTARGTGVPVPVRFPVTLHKGDRLTARVTFKPAGPGGVTGSISFATTAATLPDTTIPLYGDGTQPGLFAATPTVQFALVGDHGQFESWVPVGITVPREITITNGSAVPEKIRSVKLPPSPFSVSGLPKPGTVLAPGQSFVAAVNFAPVAAGHAYQATLTVTGNTGRSAVVSLSSRSLSPNGLFQASPSAVNLGNVPVGSQSRFTITVTNTGNEPATMDGATTLGRPFRAVYRLTPQLPVNAGYDLKLPVTFTPTKRGSFTANYKVTWTDVLGTHTLAIPIRGTGT